MTRMTIDWWTLGLQTVNVLILVWLLGRFFWRPVAAMIEQRRAAAQRMLAEAEAKRAQATAALAEIERTRAGFAAGARGDPRRGAREPPSGRGPRVCEEAAKEAAALRSGREGGDRQGTGSGRQGLGRAGEPAGGRHRRAPGRAPRRPGGARRLPRLAARGDPALAGAGAAGDGGRWRRARSDQRDAARAGRSGALPRRGSARRSEPIRRSPSRRIPR